LLAVFRVYRIEGRAFQILVAIALVALPVHYALPYRLKKPAFVAISLLGLAWVFGAAVAAVVLPLALLLIGLCRCRLPWGARVAAVGAAAVGLALARAGVVATGVPAAAWPVLGSLLMFRMILYLYELKHAREPESLVDALSYFFLLPNYCFLHFPVVDYRTFRRGYFAADVHAIQREGLRMMLRGTVHLLLYRLVYHELLVPADAVAARRAWPPTSSATTCSTCASPASSTWPAACSTCSGSSCRRPIATTCWRPGSPTSGGGSTSTGRTSWSGSSSTPWRSG
jgi:hypothetical protein